MLCPFVVALWSPPGVGRPPGKTTPANRKVFRQLFPETAQGGAGIPGSGGTPKPRLRLFGWKEGVSLFVELRRRSRHRAVQVWALATGDDYAEGTDRDRITVPSGFRDVAASPRYGWESSKTRNRTVASSTPTV